MFRSFIECLLWVRLSRWQYVIRSNAVSQSPKVSVNALPLAQRRRPWRETGGREYSAVPEGGPPTPGQLRAQAEV